MSTPSSRMWLPLVNGAFKLNYDAALSLDGHNVGYRAVIRDSFRMVLLSATKRGSTASSSKEDELHALRYGLIVARDAGFRSLYVESDNTTFISTINQGNLGFSALFLLYDDVAQLSKEFTFISFSYVNRLCI